MMSQHSTRFVHCTKVNKNAFDFKCSKITIDLGPCEIRFYFLDSVLMVKLNVIHPKSCLFNWNENLQY